MQRATSTPIWRIAQRTAGIAIVALTAAAGPASAAGKKPPHAAPGVSVATHGRAPNIAASAHTQARLREWVQPTSGVWENGCPPGLAKKDTRCMPPGQAKKRK